MKDGVWPKQRVAWEKWRSLSREPNVSVREPLIKPTPCAPYQEISPSLYILLFFIVPVQGRWCVLVPVDPTPSRHACAKPARPSLWKFIVSPLVSCLVLNAAIAGPPATRNVALHHPLCSHLCCLRWWHLPPEIGGMVEACHARTNTVTRRARRTFGKVLHIR
ncbi:hypothetical protein F4808DRAFT_162193 [Astrocystis sublimbata]|nr:hypothetical protein F4808DRAFT_162193 [Astrocystis sublimbata]